MLNLSFLRKEFKEAYRTKRFLILIALFAFFAILSPLTARYMNEIIASLGQGVQITLPDPTMNDSWIQFFKNMTSICLIVYLIIATGVVSSEKSRGSIMLVLTKRVSRLNFLLSKLIANITLFTLVYVISIVINAFYTNYLFGTFVYDGFWISLVLLWLMGVFYTSLAICFSVLTKSPTISALLGFLGFAVLSILNVIPHVQKFNPSGGIYFINQMLGGSISNIDQMFNIIFTLGFSLIVFGLSYMIFRKQEI